MAKPTVAIIQFPGSNCEYETKRAAQMAGFDAKIVRWNAPKADVEKFSAFVLPGGFSYQDRVRAGAISAKLPIIETLETAAKAGKPILGICNGCQILAETGLIPDIDGSGSVTLSMQHNQVNHSHSGFICDWVYVKVQNPGKSAFTLSFSEDEILPIPVNHGEGKFTFSNTVKNELAKLTKLKYCSSDGQIEASFPTNPNGSEGNIAGLCNPAGNVLGIMPHPERAYLSKQLPSWLPDTYKQNWHSEEGPLLRLFESMVIYCKKKSVSYAQ